ncbi:MAG: DUF4434 domain-containing protein [Flavobacteriales bacterium]
MKTNAIIFLLLLSLYSNAQVSVSLDKFLAASSFYTAFNSGSGNVNTSNNTSDYVSGTSSMQIDYSFNAGANYFFSAFKNYGTATKDWSFLTDKFILRHKGGSANTVLKLRLWEDINRNGNADSDDEVFVCGAITTGQNAWTLSDFSVNNFVRLNGNGNNALDLNRIRGWDIAIENSSGSAHSGQILLDELSLSSTYSPPSNGIAKLSGSFTQLWNSSGCACGQWTLQQWKDEFQKMKDACMTTFVVQYGVYNDLSWYSPSSLSFVTYKENTLNKIFQAAEEKGIAVYVGLYFDENWNSASKTSAAIYSSLLSKHKQVIDEVFTLFGSSSAFKGWYIPQEINDLEWQSDPAKTLLFNWVQDVAAYAHSKNNSKKVMIAPFFNLWIPADLLKTWYHDFFQIATDLDQVFPQNGVGITLKNVYYDVPLFYSKIKEACDANSVEFGATVESFQQHTGWPVDNGTFSAASADVNRLKAQIWEADTHSPVEIIQFEWAYMQGDLYNDYLTYSNCTANETEELKPMVNSSSLFYDINGKRINANYDDLAPGLYIIQTKSAEKTIWNKIIIE